MRRRPFVAGLPLALLATRTTAAGAPVATSAPRPGADDAPALALSQPVMYHHSMCVSGCAPWSAGKRNARCVMPCAAGADGATGAAAASDAIASR